MTDKPYAGKTVLYLEDQEALSKSVIKAIEISTGAKVIHAICPDAVAIPDDVKIDIVLTDNDMPHDNQGLDFIKQIRNGDIAKIQHNVPIIFSSGRGAQPEILEGLQTVSLQKPYSIKALNPTFAGAITLAATVPDLPTQKTSTPSTITSAAQTAHLSNIEADKKDEADRPRTHPGVPGSVR